MSEKLKPCPFCGSSDLAVMELLGRGLRIECEGCGAYSPVIKDGPALLTTWNTRFDNHPLTSNQFDDRETGNTSDKPQGENAMKIGDTVRKVKGYPFPGVVVADFANYKGERRLVVEARHPDILGCLHIYNPDQLEVIK